MYRSRNSQVSPAAHAALAAPRNVPHRVHAFWCRIPSHGNVGDALTPWLIRRVTGHYPMFARPGDPMTKFFVSGSIVEYTREHCVVWGSGIISRADRVSRHATFLAVRGPLTREVALAYHASCPAIYGDPALLLPRLYRSPVISRSGIGIVPHFSDKVRFNARPRGADAHAFRIIDVQQSVESFVDQVVACEVIGSSSLHGIIVAHAYGIPAVWIKFRDLPSGDDSKFHDYFLSVGEPVPAPLCIDPSKVDIACLTEHARLPDNLPDLDLLWECCPFRPASSGPC